MAIDNRQTFALSKALELLPKIRNAEAKALILRAQSTGAPTVELDRGWLGEVDSKAIDSAISKKGLDGESAFSQVSQYGQQMAKGYLTGTANVVMSVSNAVNSGVNMGLSAIGARTLKADFHLQATSPVEKAAQDAILVGSLVAPVVSSFSAANAASHIPAAVTASKAALTQSETISGEGAIARAVTAGPKIAPELSAAERAHVLRSQLLEANTLRPAGTTAATEGSFVRLPQAQSTTELNSALSALPKGLQGLAMRAIERAVETGKGLSLPAESFQRLPPENLAALEKVKSVAAKFVEQRRQLLEGWQTNLSSQGRFVREQPLAKEIDALTPGFGQLGDNAIGSLVSAAQKNIGKLGNPPTVEESVRFRDALLDVLDHVRKYGSVSEKATADVIVKSDDLPTRLANLFLAVARDGRPL